MSLQFGEFELDQERRQLLRSGKPVPLEPRAYELLVLLVERRPKALSRAQIRDVVWPGTFISESTLGVTVNAIRQALQDDARRPRFLRTVHSFGYAFCGEVAGDELDEGEREKATPLEPRSPYPGLSSFTEADAEVFFGREAEVEALWERLRRRRLLALIGPSGAGKTSFLRAGVIPARPEEWGVIVGVPGRAPMMGLAQALAPEVAGDVDAVKELLRFEDPDVAVAALQRWRQGHSEALLVVDQFEELFTLSPPEAQRRFANLLERLSSVVGVRILLSLRDDFLIRCHEQEALEPVFAELTPLLALQGEGLRRALVEPARKEGVAFEDDTLVEEMVEAVEGERGALPLLAFAVSRLWEKRDRERRLLARAAYEEIGGVAGALAQHAEQTLERIGPGREPIVRELLRNLVTAQQTRATAEREELLSVLPDREIGAHVLDQLIDARLLTSYEAREPAPSSRGTQPGTADEGSAVGTPTARRIEIVHESLLRAWPRLVRWQAQDEEGALLRDQLKQAARLWEEKGRPDDLLWTGTSEKEFELWQDRYPGALTAVEDDFASAMVQRTRRRKRLRRVAMAAVVIGLSAVAVVISVSRHQEATARRQAEAAELLALGRLELDDHPTAGLAYAVASLEITDTPAARRFAVETLAHGAPAFVIHDYMNLVTFSHDGRWVATAGLGSRPQLWSREGGPPIPLGSSGGELEFDPGGPLLLFYDGTAARILSVADAPSIREIAAAEPDPLDVWAFLRGSRLLTFRRDEANLIVRSLPIGEDEARVLGHWDDKDVAWWRPSPDGEWLAYARGRQIFVLPTEDLDSTPRLVGEHSDAVIGVGWHFRSDRLSSASASGELRIWSLQGGAWTLDRTIQSGLESLMFYVDRAGSRLAAGQWIPHQTPDVAFFWDLDGPPDADPFALRRGDVSDLNNMAIDPHGRWLATANNWIGVLWPLGGRRARVLRGQAPPLVRVAFTPDGRWLASCSGGDGAVRLWPLTPAVAPERRILLRIGAGFGNLAMDPTGRNLIAVGGADDDVVLVPLDGGAPRELERASSGGFELPAISPDGRLAAAGSRGGPTGNLIEVWDLRSGEVRTLDPRSEGEECSRDPETEGAVIGVQFTSDGRLLTSGFSGLRLWSLDDGTNVLLRPCSGAGWWPVLGGSLADRFLLLDVDPTQKASLLSFHDLRAGASRELTSHGNSVSAVALDSKGEIAVTGDWNGLVRVGPVTDEEPHLLYGHDLDVTSVAVSPDGEWIASGSQDGTIRLWPMPKGRPLHTLPYDELLARLRSLTNLRVVADEGSETGYRTEAGPFPGWAEQPEW